MKLLPTGLVVGAATALISVLVFHDAASALKTGVLFGIAAQGYELNRKRL